jgi:hypothetical protein
MPKIRQCRCFKPVVVDWNGLKRMGWPFSKTQTTDSKRADKAGYPKFKKLGTDRNSRLVWRVKDVLDYFERHGLRVTEDWYALDDEECTTTIREAAE